MKIAANDKCVLCGKDSGMPENMPINERKNYVKGCGQLCEACFCRLYRHPDSENAMTDDELQRLLELSTEEII